MKKKFLKISIILLFFILALFLLNSKVLAAKKYSAPLSYSKANLYYIKNWKGEHCIASTISVYEKVNGSKVKLSKIPKMTLESTDGKVSKPIYVEKRNSIYYFDFPVDNLDLSKKYVIKIKSGNSNNTYKAQTLSFSDELIIASSKIYVTASKNTLSLSNTYSASLSYSKANLYYVKNWKGETCIASTISVYEKVNGSKVKLSKIPKMTLESTDGKVSKPIYVEKRNSIYYFDFPIDNLDLSKKYVIKIKSGNPKNKAKPQTLSIVNEFIPITNKHIYVTINKNNISFAKTYSSKLKCGSANLEVLYNWKGEVCIGGTLNIEEYVSNASYTLTATPKINMYSENGKFYKSAYIEKRGNKYYFDVAIDDIKLNKNYYFEIKTGNKDCKASAMRVPIKSISNVLESPYKPSYKNNLVSFTKNYTKISRGTYGYSGLCYSRNSKKGSKLEYYKIGNGPNVLFAVFELHGYEDLWAKDGQELVYIAENFVKKLGESNNKYIANNWTVYVFPKANPDGLNYGYTNNGPGRTTLYSTIGKGIDLNRCWGTQFKANYSARNYTGASAFAAYEARFLRDFMLKNKSKNGQTIVIDLHGWTTQLIGNREICLDYYGPQFYGSYNNSLSKYTSSYGRGYMINWVRYNLRNNNGTYAKSALIELPSAGIRNHQSVVNAKYAQKYYNATVNMLKGILK